MTLMINDDLVVVAVVVDVAATVSDADSNGFPMGSFGFPMGFCGILWFLPKPTSVQQRFLLLPQPTPNKGKDKGQGIKGGGTDI